MPHLDIGDYSFDYDPAENELTITQPTTGETVVLDGGSIVASALTAESLTMQAQQAEPSATDNLVYLDDGTNTASGQPGFRYYDGTNWVDL